MWSPLYWRRAVVLVKMESSYGVESQPDAALHAILTSEPKIEIITDEVERSYLTQNIFSLAPEHVGMCLEASFDSEVRESLNPGVAPDCGPLLRIGAMKQTITPGVVTKYTELSKGHESATCYVWMDTLLHKLTGCRGMWSAKWDKGQFGIWSWKIQGVYAGRVSQDMPATVAYDPVLPQKVIGAYLRVTPEIQWISGAENIVTEGLGTIATTTNDAFASVKAGSYVWANNLKRRVESKTDSNTIVLAEAVNWDNDNLGYPFRYESGWVQGARNAVTVDSGTTVTTTDNAFANVLPGASIFANGTIRKVASKTSSNSLELEEAVNWDNNDAGYPFTFKNPTDFTPTISSLKLEMGNKLFRRPDLTAPDGILGIEIDGGTIKWSFDPEVPAITDHDFWDDFRNRIAHTIDFGYGAGVGANRKIAVKVNRAINGKPGYGKRGPMLTHQLEGVAEPQTIDDAIEIAFY